MRFSINPAFSKTLKRPGQFANKVDTGRVLIIHRLKIHYVLTDLMDYPTRHCTPSSSTSFSWFFTLLQCCSSTNFTVKSTSTLILVFHSCMLQSIYLQCVNTHAGIHSARATHIPALTMPRCKAWVQSVQGTAHLDLSLPLDFFAIREHGWTQALTKRNRSEPIIY